MQNVQICKYGVTLFHIGMQNVRILKYGTIALIDSECTYLKFESNTAAFQNVAPLHKTLRSMLRDFLTCGRFVRN